MMIWFLYENDSQYNLAKIYSDNKQLVKETLNKHITTSTYIVIGLILITFTGVYLYSSKKGVQYGGGRFDPIKFLFY